MDLRCGLALDFCDLGFAYPVPVLQCGFEISLEKIDGSQKVVAIGIIRRKFQCAPKIRGRGGIALLSECNARQLQREAFVPRLETEPCFKSSAGIVPAFDLCQRRAVIEVPFSGGHGSGARQVDNVLPTLFGSKSFEFARGRDCRP